MSNTVSPNMNLIIPGVGTEPGPLYAEDVNASFTLIDQHDHSIGRGVQVTPSGLNMNADLPLNGNNLTLARTLRLQPQSSDPALSTDLGILYEVGVDLYYRDGSGNAIRITQSGSVAGSTGTITGLPSGTASAAFSSGTFIFQAATLTGANIDGASHIFRNNVASSKALTLQPPNAMAADYSLTLPSLPVSKKILTLDTAGNILADYDVDNSTLEVSSNLLQVKDQGITQPKLAPKGFNTAGVGSISVSGSSGSFLTTSTSFVDVSNLVGQITESSSQRPIKLLITSDANGGGAQFGTVPGAAMDIRIVDPTGAVEFARWTISTNNLSAAGCLEALHLIPGIALQQYKVQAKSSSGGSVAVINCRLIVYEI